MVLLAFKDMTTKRSNYEERFIYLQPALNHPKGSNPWTVLGSDHYLIGNRSVYHPHEDNDLRYD